MATLASPFVANAFPGNLVFLDLSGPKVAPMWVAHTYSGTLAAGRRPLPAGPVGIPNQSVVILVDGVTTRQVVTGANGSYTASFPLVSPGAHTVEAVAYAGTPAETRSTPLIVHTVADAISVGSSGTCVRDSAVPPLCFGAGGTPQPAGFNDRANVVDTNGSVTCAILPSSANAYCLGNNSWGQLGDGTHTSSTTPVAVVAVTDFIDISVGNLHTCAVRNDTTAWCWGGENDGELGNGPAGPTPVATSVVGLTGATSISAGDEHHTCAVLADGTARCWGGDGLGELGNGPGGDSDVPVVVVGLANTVAIAAGGEHTCALIASGFAQCWGDNFSGEVGDGTNVHRQTPTTVTGINSAVDITTGSHFSCALLSDGTARCWGQNGSGQIGNGTTADSNVPVVVTGLSSAIDIDTGGSTACALLSDRTIRCWGAGYGSTPVVVQGYP